MSSRFRKVIFFGLAMVLAVAGSHAAKLKTTYSGSGMATDSSSRVITLQLSKDGTGVYQEHSGKGDIHKPIHWFRDGKTVTLEFEPGAGDAPKIPLVFEVKRNSLVPVGEVNRKLGVVGFPILHPFGPADLGTSTGMSTCVTGAPGPCVMRETWNSNQSAR